jgi:hypothetical protein
VHPFPELGLAVIKIAADPVPGIEPALIAFGKIPTDGVPRQCLGSGFPEAAGVDQRTITGTLTWVLTGRRFDIDVTSGPPREWKKWAGFSGTGIFVGDLLVGVVRTVDGNWNGRVTAVSGLVALGEILTAEQQRHARKANRGVLSRFEVGTIRRDPRSMPLRCPLKRLNRRSRVADNQCRGLDPPSPRNHESSNRSVREAIRQINQISDRHAFNRYTVLEATMR